MSILNFADIAYGGGAVPQSTSTFYSGITLYNARPMITNAQVAKTGGAGGTEGAIAGDMNSLREDDTARGPLIRQVTTVGNSLNGFYLMAQSNGIIEPTNAMPYADNPATLGGSQNYTLAIPLPVVITAQLFVGQQLLENTGGETEWVTNRLYIQPGSMIKLNKGSGIDLLNPGASLNVGTRSYINGYDANNNYGPNSPGFVAPGSTDPTVLFTSIYDDTASTPFVPAINVTGETTTPTLGPSMWGSVGIITGGIVVINDATFQYGGGALNTQNYTIDSQSVLAFITEETTFQFSPTWNPDAGTHAYITNNNFYHNFDAAMQIEPNGLLAGNPLTPLESGHPFFRGNVMSGNGIDGLAVVTNRIYYLDPNNSMQYIGPREAIAGAGYDNQTVNAVWDATDLTYVLRGTLILGGAYSFNFNSSTGQFETSAPLPNQNAFGAEPSPIVTLTIQSALPGTELANGQAVPSPGQSVIVKLLNDETPFGAGSLATPGASTLMAENAGAGFVVGVDDGVDPPGNSPLVDPGAYSELRILGIPGNQTTGQQRVPVIITSLRDGSVGTTVRGVSMYNILESDPLYTGYINQGASLTTPAAGDGGIIYIGGNSMHSYSATDPFDGSVISNADMSYLTRVEVQGGGIVDATNDTGSPAAPTISTTDWWDTLNGYLSPTTQLNTPMSLTIANSNLADFSDAGVFVHPGSAASLYRDWTNFTPTTGGGGFGIPGPPVARGSLAGEPVFLYMYNDTISNSGTGVQINSQTGNDSDGDSVYLATILNCTFYNDGYGIHTVAPAHNNNPDNSYSSVNVLAMNNIFDGSANVAVDFEGQNAFSQLQYNLFYNNATNIVSTTNDGDFGGNNGPSYGDPQFVGPVGGNLPATSQNFELKSTSPAIDAGRSEIGPLAQGNALYPGISYPTSGTDLTGTRINPANIPLQDVPGRADVFGEFGGFFFFSQNQIYLGLYDSRQIVTLPGSGYFNFPDQWQPVLDGTAGSYTGPSSNANTYSYQPYTGVRDILGYIRVPDPNVPGVGYGSNPFIDIGAYQYVNLHPPEVTSVTATVSSTTSSTGSASIPFYTVGGQAGSNTTPLTITVGFNEPINPSTLTGDTVLLQEMGIAPGTTAKTISLSGKLSYDSGTSTLVINLGAAGLTLPTDAYRLVLVGSGSPVVQNTQGIALDGEDLSNGNDPNTGVQQALPSGNGYPGGNFYDTFIINTTPPVVVPGSLQMSPTSDSNIVGDNITTSSTPTFTGQISEPNPALVQLNGQTAILNIGIALNVNGTVKTFFDPSQLPANLSSYAQYIRQNAGTGLTDANGNFSVTVGVDAANSGLVTNTNGLPDLFPIYNVGADGKLSPLPGDDNGYYVAQVVAQDQSGNRSTPTASNQVPFVVDNTAPTVQFVSPTSGQVITSLTNGQVGFTIQTDQNIDRTNLNASSVQLISAGPDGILGTADDVTINIDPNSFQVTYQDQGSGGKGAEQITFTTTGTVTNGPYEVTLLNTGAGAIRDIAGNLMASPVTLDFAVNVPSLSTTLFVGRGSYVTDPGATQGSRANPYPTITEAMTAATAGDVVAVLPGVYTENVSMKQFVRLYSASASSTDTTVFSTSTGDPLSTVIRASQSSTDLFTVTADSLQSYSGLQTEIAGFTIASPLVGDPALGTINSSAAALYVKNSDLLIDKNYFADAGMGIDIETSGASARTPQVKDNVIAGNINGIVINDAGSTSASAAPVPIINNDFVFNTTGLLLSNSARRRCRRMLRAISSGRTTTSRTPALATPSTPPRRTRST